MSFDLSKLTVSTELQEVPADTVSRGRAYEPSPFDALFAAGPTPEGKAYTLDVPRGEDAGEARKEITRELQRAVSHYNKSAGKHPLGFRTRVGKG